MVGDTFFMTVKGGAGTRRIDCEIETRHAAPGHPRRRHRLGAHRRHDGASCTKSLSELPRPIVFDSVRVKVDGVVLPRGPLAISDAYDMPLESGNLIRP